jgi:S-DNA-T family DNA segregation ATPase FtsK/SpoIIIE
MWGRIWPSPQDRARRELRKQLHREADYFAAVIQARLTQLGIAYRYAKSEKDFVQSNVQQVDFLKAVGTPEGIYLMVDSRRLPRGVRIADLDDDAVLDDLSVACRRPVRFRYSVRSGAWFIVERASGAWGVPRKLVFKEVLAEWPHSSRKKLLVPMGVGENRKLTYRSLANFPHALIGGATGAGKTTMLHGWICSLLMKNPPADLRVGLVDLKGGVEFTRYRALGHVLGNQEGDDVDGFAKLADGVVPLLEWLRQEMDGRLERFERAGGIQNVDIWNYRRRSDHLPRIVLFVDELASLMLDRSIKKEAEALLADLTARGRGPGIHVVLSTQRPERGVISGLIKGNVDVRCAFRVPDNASSMVILDTTEAARFDDSTPLGRYIYRRGNEKEELQAPWITPGQLDEIVRSIDEGHDGAEAAQIAPEDVFRLAVTQLEGNFSRRVLYDALGGRVSQRYLERLGREHEGEVVEVDGELYEMQPSTGNIPRTLAPIGVDCGENDVPHPTPQNAKRKTQGAEAAQIAPEDVFRLAVTQLEGNFSLRTLYDALGGQVTQQYLIDLGAEYEGQVVEVDGADYVLEPAAGPNPRRLVPVGGTVEDVEGELIESPF